MKSWAAGVAMAVVVGWAGGATTAAQGGTEPQAPAAVTPDLAAKPAPPPPPSTPARSTIIEKVLVRVNGEIFTQSELTQRQVEAVRESNQGNLTDDRLQAELARITPIILVDAVDDLLLVQRGREMGVKFTEEAFNRALENIKKDNKLDDAQLKEALKQQGMTLEQLRQNLERAELRRAVQQREIGPSMTITQEEQRQYYVSHRDQFMTPETVTLRQLLVPVPSRTAEGGSQPDPIADAAAKLRIEGLRAQAVAGADFAQLVRDNTPADSPSRTTGGLVGPVKVDELNPVLKDAILSLKPGEVSPPIRTGGGYQILKLDSRTVPELRSFDSVRAEVENEIRNERLEPATEEMLQRLRIEAVIEWKDESYRTMYEAARKVSPEPGSQPLPGPAGSTPPAAAPPATPPPAAAIPGTPGAASPARP